MKESQTLIFKIY